MAPVLSSTFFLTLLLGVGLFFFLRAATKDRTELGQYETPWDEAALLDKLQQYFAARSYDVTGVNPERGEITLIGLVRASLPLAIFLSLLAATGLGCLALVLALLFPTVGWGFAGLLVVAPLAGVFYWRGATRPEQVSFRIAEVGTGRDRVTCLRVSAHRDELLTLQGQLGLKPTEAELS